MPLARPSFCRITAKMAVRAPEITLIKKKFILSSLPFRVISLINSPIIKAENISFIVPPKRIAHEPAPKAEKNNVTTGKIEKPLLRKMHNSENLVAAENNA